MSHQQVASLVWLLMGDGGGWQWVAGTKAREEGVIVVDIIGNGRPGYCNISPGCGND